ncbi:hypothetical protein PanWU01x14_069630 [Parasponia andersonii]|uniref:Uncharacterized protein n=1 Tax=Parasponia andersonii TaxID=3476 RepID=A0A2P5DFQ4_PARAD|nr:hypothetical protein PanWU01x14_069630 [Parasponia andersonii]
MQLLRRALEREEDFDLENLLALLTASISAEKRRQGDQVGMNKLDEDCLRLATYMSEGKRLQKLEYGVKDVNLVNVFSVLPPDLQNSPKKHLGEPILSETEPLDLVLFITQGVAWQFISSDQNIAVTKPERKNFLGKQLIEILAPRKGGDGKVPISVSESNVKSHAVFEGLVLMVVDLEKYSVLVQTTLKLTPLKTPPLTPLLKSGWSSWLAMLSN